MGVKTLDALAIGGGVPCWMLPYSKGASVLPEFPSAPKVQKGIKSGQKGAKMKFYLGVLGVFSGKSETKKGKSKYIFGF